MQFLHPRYLESLIHAHPSLSSSPPSFSSSSTRDVFLDSDSFWLHSAAGGLLTLQKVFGEIPNSVFIGSASCDVQKILASIKANEDASASSDSAAFSAGKSGIHTAIVLDRNLDLVTPMLTQITYEGVEQWLSAMFILS